MFRYTCIGLILVLSLIHHTITLSRSEFGIILRNLGVIPEVLDYPPHHVVNVTWRREAAADFGNLIPYEQVLLPPVVVWPHNESSYYTLLFTDCDDHANEEVYMKEYHLWYVTNIPGLNISAGEVRLEYTAPDMQPGSNKHRIAVTVLEQPDFVNMSMSEFKSPPRYYFAVMELVHDLPALIHASNVFTVLSPLNRTATPFSY